jgi:squalene synthase HpnC
MSRRQTGLLRSTASKRRSTPSPREPRPPRRRFPSSPPPLRGTAWNSRRSAICSRRSDRTTTRYGTETELFDYCRRSANPIGRLVLRIFDADAPANLVASDAICTALQLINFWQDIAADWVKGRIYLPAEDLGRFGVTEAHIAEARCDDAWSALMAFESVRARALLESGRPLTRALPWRLRLEISGVLAGGHRILDGIDATGGDVFRRRPKLSGGDWAGVACSAIFPPRRHRPA